jgi:hypothetical protein
MRLPPARSRGPESEAPEVEAPETAAAAAESEPSDGDS